MRFQTEQEAITYLFRSRDKGKKRGLDEVSRDVSSTRRLLLRTNLPATKREHVVITGSKGKGSTAAITAKVLQHLGHKTGLITSPHLRTWYERIRINGEAIPKVDFLRIASDLAPDIDAIEATLTDTQYISPQGILLLVALRYFDEQSVTAAVVEVGRGGRFDDMALVPNKVALFTPIVMEHAQYMGDSLERIAWHKSGIIPHGGFAYSVAQSPDVMTVLQTEADTRDCEFFWFSSGDTGEFITDTPNGIRFRLQRYGEVELSLHGHYQMQNAALAIQAAGNMHARLQGIAHSSPEYVARVKAALADVTWFGRVQVMQMQPQVIVDGAINVLSVRSFLKSVASRVTSPLIIIAGVPSDRDYDAVYKLLAKKADALILTASNINPGIQFPDKDHALTVARQYHDTVQYHARLPDALEAASTLSGDSGTVLLSVAQPLVGEAMLLWDVDTSRL
ncbi:MAG: bifunctional folylpolyglutamate synthase/dihydrofolate synthase [Aggregatilineales bacterium]